MRKKIFLLCKIFAKFLLLNLHTDFRPREESVTYFSYDYVVRCVFISRKISCTCFSIDSFVEGFLKKRFVFKMSSFVHEAWRMLFAKKCLGGGKFIVFMLVPSMKREARSIFRTILNSPWPQDARPQTDATWLWKKHIKSMGNSWREDLRDSLFPFLELPWYTYWRHFSMQH